MGLRSNHLQQQIRSQVLAWLDRVVAAEGGAATAAEDASKETDAVGTAKVDDGDRSAHEHECLCLVLELGGCYDQLDGGSLAALEVVARRPQLIEESKSSGGVAAYEGAKYFMGYRRGGTLLAPSLSEHVSKKLQEEVSIMKERRKHA